jgi:hypothetical protein
MADAIWKTVELYGLEGKVCASLHTLYITTCWKTSRFCDGSALNNNTMVQHSQQKCKDRGIEFDTEEARIRCMPHIVHLAAIKVAYDSFSLF